MINKKIASEIAFGIILLLVVAIGGFFWLQNQASVTTLESQITTSVTIQPNEVGQETELVENAQKNKESIYVPSQLKELQDLKLINPREGDPTAKVSYYEVSSINIDGAKLILAADSYCDGAGCAPGYYRFLQKGDVFTLLTKYSAPVDGSYGLLKTDLNVSKFSNIDIPELLLPAKLKDSNVGALFKLDSGSYVTGHFFNPENKKLLFSSNGWELFSDGNDTNSESLYM